MSKRKTKATKDYAPWKNLNEAGKRRQIYSQEEKEVSKKKHG